MQAKSLSGLNKERENTIESGRSLAESDRHGGSDGRRSPLTRGRWLASAGPAGSPAHVEARGANESLRMARPWDLNCPVPPTTASEPRLEQVQTSRLPSAVTMTALSGDAVCR